MSLTATEAAARLGLHPKTLRQKLRDGVIKGRQVGKNTWVVEEHDLEVYTRRSGNSRPAGAPHRASPGPENLNETDREATEPATAPPSASATPEELRIPGLEVAARNSALTPHGGPAGGAVAWLLLAVGDNRAFGSNDGYDDEPAEHYKWDDTVPNHAGIAVGDAVVLWDKKTSIGASIVESIETARRTKPVYSCPACDKAHIKARRTKTPRYKCFNCQAVFDKPITKIKDVTEYTSIHSTGWVDLSGLLSGVQLRALCESPKSQLSLRPLKWEQFKDAVTEAGSPELLTVVESSWRTIAGGHRTSSVRVRLGQAAFRRQLLAKNGAVCAFTGKTPAAALEAAHLYSYAKAGEHHEDGGFLLRRDLHTLFDLGHIAVHPDTLTINITTSLADYPVYRELSGRLLSVKVSKNQRGWLRRHWNEHRPNTA